MLRGEHEKSNLTLVAKSTQCGIICCQPPVVGLSPSRSFGADAAGIVLARYQKRFFEATIRFVQGKPRASPAKALEMAIDVHAQQDLSRPTRS
jgi:hypothetical protein